MKAEPIRYCKGLEENPEVIERNMLNVSKSKMQYSFSQADRFQNKKMYIHHNQVSLHHLNSMIYQIYGFPREKV